MRSKSARVVPSSGRWKSGSRRRSSSRMVTVPQRTIAPVMPRLDFLAFNADFSSPQILAAYDELPLWSAMFGLLLLEEAPLANVGRALDVGCGTGFPLVELAE